MMKSAEIALVSGLKLGVGCQERLWVNSHADEILVGKEVCEVSAILQLRKIFIIWQSSNLMYVTKLTNH